MSVIYFVSALLAAATLLIAASTVKIMRLRKQRDSLLREKDVAYSFVHDVGDVFAGSETLDVSGLLERVLFYAQRTTRASSGAIYLFESNRETLRACAVSGTFPPIVGGVPPEGQHTTGMLPVIARAVREQTVRTGEGIIGGVVADATPVLITHAELDARIPRFNQDFLQIRSILAVPMRFHEEILGVAVVVNRIDGEPFTETDKSLLESLADQASVTLHYMQQSAALDDKRQMDRDLGIAQQIQMALLPHNIPVVPPLDIAAFCEAARRVGGDYYDFLQVDDNHLGIFIADVSGKGISGALIMATCRSIVRAHAPGTLSPATLLSTVNRAIADDLSEGMFITALYMLINTRTLNLRVARAGHLHPIICRKDGSEPVKIESRGMALGIGIPSAFDSAIEEQELALHGGDTIIAYTDGISEAMDVNQNEWTAASLVDSVQATLRQGGKAHDVAQNVKRDLLEFVGNAPQYDDMTFVTLQVG